jgi:hypothetical protein
MAAQLINQKKLERADRTREVIHELMECDTEQEFNSVVEIYRKDIIDLKLEHHVAGAIKRIKAVEINKSFNIKN